MPGSRSTAGKRNSGADNFTLKVVEPSRSFMGAVRL